jgi:DNA/RNA endonuclease YhcR with UshA esterase domain
MVGNDNSGNLTKGEMLTTQDGIDLVNATGAELLFPGEAPPVPPSIEMIGRLEFGTDKPGKDTNFRGLTIFNNTLYVSKGSGSNGVNTVYQAGTPGTLPTGSAADLAKVPLTILPGFPSTAASTSTAFPFGLFFADANTLYVCDEGDGTLVSPVNGNVADAQSLATAGLQKWSLVNGTWKMQYVLQNGLNIGVPYSIAGYPSSLNPATGGCRNITGVHNNDGTVTIFAITSTISTNGDTGADPNKLVKVTDRVSDTTLPSGNGLGQFTTIRAAQAGEVLRGVALAPDESNGFSGQ